MSSSARALLLGALLLMAHTTLRAEDLRLSVPLPMGADPGAVWYKLARAIAREWGNGKATVLPPRSFETSLSDVVAGRADVHLPLIAGPAGSEDNLPYRYSNLTLSETPFALYVQQGDTRFEQGKLTISHLARYRIETERAHAGLFFGKVRESDSIEESLREVVAGKIDGFLFSAHTTDPLIRQKRIGPLQRIPYRRLANKMVFAKGASGEALEEKLGLIIDRLKESGEYQTIMAPKLNERAAP